MDNTKLKEITQRLNDLTPVLKDLTRDMSELVKEDISEEAKGILHEIDLILARAVNRLEFQLIDLNSEVKSNTIIPNRFSQTLNDYKPL